MKKAQHKILFLVAFVVVCVFLQISCDNKFDLSLLPDPAQRVVVGDTNYVEIQPPWGGFQSPRAILVGNDQLIYVADYDANEVVMIDAGGTVLGRRSILHPTALAQNTKLDLYVGGESIAPNGVDTVGTIFRVFLARFDTFHIAGYDTLIDTVANDTTITPIIQGDTLFTNHAISSVPMHAVRRELAHPARRFTGIGMLPSNDYLAARTGPDNSSFVDPDSRVLLMNKGDTLITPLADLTTRPSGGTGITDINQLTGLTTFPSSKDFIVTQSSEGTAFGAIWMVYQKTIDFDGWVPKYDPQKAEQRNVDFLRLNSYLQASGAAVDRRRRDIFIVDAGLDSVVKFDRNGRFKTESFGKYKTTEYSVSSRGVTTLVLPGLNNPRGITFSNDCTLYIADTGNKIIRRFRIPSQTQCF